MELVIVIAILAILTGVGAAGYAGHIKKANNVEAIYRKKM